MDVWTSDRLSRMRGYRSRMSRRGAAHRLRQMSRHQVALPRFVVPQNAAPSAGNRIEVAGEERATVGRDETKGAMLQPRVEPANF